jgi:ElaB/YqjD/DUF883 family membrane-anchored ribosome-binding protein
MLKSPKTKRHTQHDLYDDLAKIKAIMSTTAFDVKDSAVDILSDSLDIAKEKTSLIDKTISRYARKKPMKSLGICFLSGLCISYLIKRR